MHTPNRRRIKTYIGGTHVTDLCLIRGKSIQTLPSRRLTVMVNTKYVTRIASVSPDRLDYSGMTCDLEAGSINSPLVYSLVQPIPHIYGLFTLLEVMYKGGTNLPSICKKSSPFNWFIGGDDFVFKVDTVYRAYDVLDIHYRK